MVVMLTVTCEVEVDMSRFGDKKETKAETDANCLYRQLGHPIGTTRMIENGKWGRCDFIIFIIFLLLLGKEH